MRSVCLIHLDAAFRPLTAADPASVASFCRGLDDNAVRRLRGDLAAGTVQPGWCWAAYADGEPVARHVWWGPIGATAPVVLDLVDVGDPSVGAALVEHARDVVGVEEAWTQVTLPGDGDDDPWSARPQTVELLERAGFAFTVARVRVELLDPVAVTPPDRLVFRPAGAVDADGLVALFAAVADGSLDHAMVTDRALFGAETEARRRLRFLSGYPGVDDRLTVAFDRDDVAVGYVAPAWDGRMGIVAEIGVAAQHRGRGYVDDLLTFAAHELQAAGAQRIVADTDRANAPMRAAFARAGYREFARRWDWEWRRPRP